MANKLYTITEINKYIKDLLINDSKLSDLWLTGEISNFNHHNSGHMYLTLKDKNASIKAIIFRGNNRHLKFKLEDGLKVNAHGYIGLYEVRGDYQFYIDHLEPAGKGALYLAFEQLKEKLKKEGLFAEEKKQKIPILPKKIGIVTSPTGAAIRDILSVVKRRFDNISVLIVPSLVQGEQAKTQIVNGIEYLNQRNDIDLIIVSRGGGSIEELWPFNEEIVARAIYNSPLPVIAGVGHETDYTIADFVADLRAPTPSAAAELAIASRLELEKNLANIYNRLCSSIQYSLDSKQKKLEALASKRFFTKPTDLFSKQKQALDELSRSLEWTIDKKVSSLREKFNVLNGKIESLSPLKTLKRGYSISTVSDKLVTKVADVNLGDKLCTRINDGLIISKVEGVKKDGD